MEHNNSDNKYNESYNESDNDLYTEDPRLTLLNTIKPKLSPSDHCKLMSHNTILVVSSNIMRTYTHWEIKDISYENVGDWFEMCDFLKNHITGYLVWTKIGYDQQIIEYKNTEEIKVWSLLENELSDLYEQHKNDI